MKKPIIISIIMLILFMMVSCTSDLPSPVNTTVTPTQSPSTTETTTPEPQETAKPTDTPTPTPTPTPDATQSPTPTPDGTEAPASDPESTGTPTYPVLTGDPDRAPIQVKAIYLSGSVVGARFDHYIDLLNQTELNALVIDIKEGGYVNYKSNVPLVKELGLSVNNYNPEEIIKKCHDNNIYVIGRIVCFRDNGLPKKKPEYGIKKPDGTLWGEKTSTGTIYWANPSIPEVQQYNINIAKEAIALGFDEIQFDYVRFPTGKASEFAYAADMPSKGDVIAGFLGRASQEIKKVKQVPVSADVFGIIGESDSDGKALGQVLSQLGQNVDYISPMIYPSHYANDSHGTMGNGVGQTINGVLFTQPDLHPYEVVYNALLKIKSKISTYAGFRADVRPYIQDFTATYLPKGYFQDYGVEQIRQQIQAVKDAGYNEWIFWDGSNTYTEDAFEKNP